VGIRESIVEERKGALRDMLCATTIAGACGVLAVGAAVGIEASGLDYTQVNPRALGVLAGSTYTAIATSLLAVRSGQEAAALSGALAQHSLETGVPFNQDA
jgi:hypothetical protein